ncbi:MULTISPECIES: hypothetical protein [Nocardia]|uniref:hypothetical protein n=1 Tax=Nocardia TaxID=1817 RepID=UPI00130076BD|nr:MULTISPECIES: hypothetical protein [Nocardia]
MSTDRATVENVARACGYELVRIITIDEQTYMPITFIVDEAVKNRAAVIVTPDMCHFGVGYQVITVACSVRLPGEFLPRQSKPPY